MRMSRSEHGMKNLEPLVAPGVRVLFGQDEHGSAGSLGDFTGSGRYICSVLFFCFLVESLSPILFFLLCLLHC